MTLSNPPTPEELDLFREWCYRVSERLGMMVEEGVPTWEQLRLAHEQADRDIEEIKNNLRIGLTPYGRRR